MRYHAAVYAVRNLQGKDVDQMTDEERGQALAYAQETYIREKQQANYQEQQHIANQ